MRSGEDKVTFERTVVNMETGEVTEQETVVKKSEEPDYVKIYLDCLTTFKGLGTTLNPILLELLRSMSFADAEDGGQIIQVTGYLRARVAKKVGKTERRVKQAIAQFVKSGLFRRVGRAAYQVNPYVLGLGKWRDIKALRTKIDWCAGTWTTEVEHGGAADGEATDEERQAEREAAEG